MTTAINLIQIIVSLLLIIAIVLQQRGAGLGGVFGGGGEIYQTKRGVEKFLFILTIILSIIFLGTALANLIV